MGEDILNGGPVGEVDVPKGDVEGWGREAGAGAGNEGWNVSMRLKREDSGEGWGLSKELVLGGEG